MSADVPDRAMPNTNRATGRAAVPALRGGRHEHNFALDAACSARARCSTIRWSGGRPARYRRYICSKSVSRLRVTAATH